MIEIKIRPLSVNRAWRGRRFKTQDYKDYEKELCYLLPKVEIPEGKLIINFIVGYKNKLSDIDNFLKPFIDVMQKKYGFDDNKIYKLVVTKEVGKEFIKFKIESYERQANRDIQESKNKGF